ncbi:MAG: hypothetical protein LC123_07915 [Burkholderiales bacterium]|nr:hypothetical protein [Burkholderiales bacterium]
MIDPQTIGLVLVGLFLLACATSAGFTFWLTCRLYDEKVDRRDETIKTLRAALAQEIKEAKVAAESRRNMSEADRARAEALAVGDATARLERVLALFPDARPKPTPAAASAAHDAGGGGSAGAGEQVA